PTPMAPGCAPVTTVTPARGLGLRTAAIPRHTGQTQHASVPVENARAPRSAKEAAARVAETSRSASSRMSPPSVISALHPALELAERRIHDHLFGLALEHAEHP